jgi:chitinase
MPNAGVAVFVAVVILSHFTSPARADWPARVSIPYMYLGAGDNFKLTDCDDTCGQKFYTLAFIIADKNNQPAWDGRWPLEENRYADQIAAIRKRGGDIVVSFGGEAGKEIALVEPDEQKLFAMYEAVIDKYSFTWLDFDIEGNAMKDHDANRRRNAVIKKLQVKHPGLIVSFTVPVVPDGMNPNSIKMITDAHKQGVKIHSANIMTMFFGEKYNQKMSMLQMCTASANKAHEQTQAIDPQIQIGLCPLIGYNGAEKFQETFSVDDARKLQEWASKTDWICSLSFWCVNRDAATGKKGGNTDSGVKQERFAFTKAFQPFIRK